MKFLESYNPVVYVTDRSQAAVPKLLLILCSFMLCTNEGVGFI